MLANTPALAAENNPVVDAAQSIFLQPWIWVAAITVSLIILVGPLKEECGEFVVRRRKVGKKGRAVRNNDSAIW